MWYIIGIIVAIIATMTVGLILRKRNYDEIDRQDAWKIDIMNRDISTQLSRIKKLNLSGETQEKFESWKERWEFILSKELTDIEAYLLNAEEATDRYRFPTAKKTLRKSNQTLQSIEKDIDKIVHEVDELMDSEESSRKKYEHIQHTMKKLRQQLSQNNYQYGKAEVRFEVELDELEESIQPYNELVDSGNYIEAKTVVDKLRERLEVIEELITEFPSIYKACKQELPSQLDELYRGIREMKDEGYRVEQLGLEREIDNYQQRLLDCVHVLNQGETSEAKAFINELEERIQEIYQILEKEAIAKRFIESKIPGFQKSLSEIAASFEETQVEVESLKHSYYIDAKDMEKYLALDQNIGQLKSKFDEMINELNEDNKNTHIELREQLETGLEQLESLHQKHESFKLTVNNLRKDELEAKEKLNEMGEKLHQLNRKVKKSNIPGVPEYIWKLSNDTTEKNNDVLQALEKQPLDIAEVQQVLSEAKTLFQQLVEQTDEMLELAYLAEQVIQYANRYRSNYPVLAGKLVEAENMFRSYEYGQALETAGQALEEVEPGALKVIEENHMITN